MQMAAVMAFAPTVGEDYKLHGEQITKDDLVAWLEKNWGDGKGISASVRARLTVQGHELRAIELDLQSLEERKKAILEKKKGILNAMEL